MNAAGHFGGWRGASEGRYPQRSLTEQATKPAVKRAAARRVLLADDGTRAWVIRGLDLVLPSKKGKKAEPSPAADPLTPLGLRPHGVAFVWDPKDGRKVIEILGESGVSALSQGSATDGYNIHADHPERASAVLRHAVGSGRLDATRVTLTWEDGQKVAWLRKALAHNLTDEVRKLKAASRDVGRERSLEVALEDSSARLEAWLGTKQSSPTQQAIVLGTLNSLAEPNSRNAMRT